MKLVEIKKSYLNKQISKEEYIDKMFQIHKILYEYGELIKKSDLKNIEINDGQVVFTSRSGVRLVSRYPDRRLAPVDVLNFGSYEKYELAMLLELVEDGYSIFDIGANVGWYSIFFEKKFPSSPIHAFEPIRKTFESLKINVGLNNSKNIKIYNFGFSDKKANQVFYLDDEESVSASMKNLKNSKKASKFVCKVMRLDDFSKREKVNVDFMKCDVEGAELLVFKGGMETIVKNKPIIFAEMLRKWSFRFSYHPDEIIELLGGLGYACFFTNGRKLKRISKITDKTKATNFFFLHKVKHNNKIKKLTL